MKSITLDTNAYSNYIKGDLLVINEVKESDVIFLPTVVIGELYSGFYRGSKLKDNETLLNLFLNNIFVQVSHIRKNTSKIYGQIYSELSKKGESIPTNDVWIAACAIENDSTLITYDKHFLKVSNLNMWEEIKKVD